MQTATPAVPYPPYLGCGHRGLRMLGTALLSAVVSRVQAFHNPHGNIKYYKDCYCGTVPGGTRSEAPSVPRHHFKESSEVGLPKGLVTQDFANTANGITRRWRREMVIRYSASCTKFQRGSGQNGIQWSFTIAKIL